MDVLMEEMTKDQMKVTIQEKVISPMIVLLYKQLYPYIYTIVIVIFLMFIMLIVLLVSFIIYLRK